jgi:hypothetical protein
MSKATSKKNNSAIVLIVFAIIFFNVFMGLFSQESSPAFLIFLVFFILYIKFIRPFKQLKGTSWTDTDAEYSKLKSMLQAEAGEDAVPFPLQETAGTAVRTKRSDQEKDAWGPAAENYIKEEEDENSEGYWRNREAKKISKGRIFEDERVVKKEGSGRFR